MRLSIALATYNGSQYLPQQLESLKNQQRLPDELVVVDDASTDETVKILRRFQSEAPFPVRLEVAEANRGPLASFERAIRLCEDDVILLSDQDDVWHPNKTARVEGAFVDHPEAQFAFSDADLIDGSGQTLPGTLWEEKSFGAMEQAVFKSGAAFELLLERSTVTGCTLAFRREQVPLLVPFPADGPLLHDAWIALLLAAISEPLFLPEKLLSYRHHHSQFTEVNAAGREKTPQEVRAARLTQLRGHLLQLQEALRRLEAANTGKDKNLLQLRSKIRHLQRRTGLPGNRILRLFAIGTELLNGGYRHHSNGLRSAILDVYSRRAP